MPQLRLASPDDAPGIATIYAPIVEHTSISFEIDIPGPDEIARRVRAVLARWPWLVIDDGTILGYAYAGEHRTRAAYRWSADVSVYVAAHARRTGVGRHLYGALFDILRQQGYYNVFAGVTLPNEPSLALHRALGFEAVGIYRDVGYKLGAWYDVSWWQRRLLSPTAMVAEPLPFATMSDSVAAALQRPTFNA